MKTLLICLVLLGDVAIAYGLCAWFWRTTLLGTLLISMICILFGSTCRAIAKEFLKEVKEYE